MINIIIGIISFVIASKVSIKAFKWAIAKLESKVIIKEG